MKCSLLLASMAAVSVLVGSGTAHAAHYDLFYAGGQSNAWPDWASAIRTELAASGRYQNVVVINGYHPGASLSSWYTAGQRQSNYVQDFYDPGSGAGALEARIAQITAAGDTYSIRGFFWFQGEADSGTQAQINAYQSTFQAMLGSVKSDLGITTDMPLVMTLIWGVPSLLDQTRVDQIAQLRQIQKDIAASVNTGTWIDSQTYTRFDGDPWHLTFPEQARLGKDSADTFLAMVPEPSFALSLLGGGIMLLAGRRRGGQGCVVR